MSYYGMTFDQVAEKKGVSSRMHLLKLEESATADVFWRCLMVLGDCQIGASSRTQTCPSGRQTFRRIPLSGGVPLCRQQKVLNRAFQFPACCRKRDRGSR